ncbi:hypothetical protein ACJMK2_032059 [Sinanodonta woodiana]|uniref:C-type lectin domain-containing protein n=1 Tax=Sinanodonta woodiana TaxID=1069815 RepID=A0ABD3X471_SINWO
MRIIISMLLTLSLQLSRIPYASSSNGNACPDKPMEVDQGSPYSSVNLLMGNSLCDRVIQQDIPNAMKPVCMGATKLADEVYKGMIPRIKTLDKSIDDMLTRLATLKLNTGLPTCRVGYEYYAEDRFCYMLHSECKTWSEARQICRQEGGDLISLNDYNFKYFKDVARLKAGACNHVWVGTTDIAVEGKWNWLNGLNVSSSFWQPQQPDNWDNKEHCGDLKSPDYLLNDERCDIPLHFLCQIRKS